MRKQIVALLAGAMLMMATSAMATPLPGTGYTWTNADFFSITDFTTASNGSADFLIQFENPSRLSDFGLYTVDNINAPTAVLSQLQLFAYSPDFIGDVATAYFKIVGTTVQASTDNINYQNFDSNFGFYFGRHTGATLTSTYYTASNLNPTTGNPERIFTATDNISHVKVLYVQDGVRPTDTTDTDIFERVLAIDVQPVPEPGTMMLLGFGMLSLAIYGKRRMNKEA